MRFLVYFILYYLIRYRRKIVFENISSSFPQLDATLLTKKYYRNLAGLIVETIKFSMVPVKNITKQVHIVNPELIDQLMAEGKGFIVLMGHFSNWEYAGAALSLYTRHHMAAVYKPLKNKFFNRLLVDSRKRFGSDLFPINDFRKFVHYKKKGMGIIVIADQSPTKKQPHIWIDFLSKKTAFHYGPEKFAKKLDMPVIYGQIEKDNKISYKLTLHVITYNPKESEDGEITNEFARFLESDMIKFPENWLWSHRRWKLKP
jgi:Kdo2-lipid IVA lauroyltransferase/acyltransferase